MNRGERELRVIGGRLRGRKWRFPEAPGLRPTPDRVRETLFNWLQTRIAGARCLDLYAGSGALGIEALSRGAAEVVFCESVARAAADLRATLDRFGLAPVASVVGDAAEHALPMLRGRFDVAFLDPPFDKGLLAPALHGLAGRALLAPDALVYIEMPAREGLPSLPAGWHEHRSGKAGEVGYHLLIAARPATPTEPP